MREVDSSAGRKESSYLFEIDGGAAREATPAREKKMRPEGRKGSGRSRENRVISKRDSDHWQATLTEGDRGGLDTIFISNLGKMC